MSRTTDALTVKRKADRAKMAGALIATAGRLGSSITTEVTGTEIVLRIVAGPVATYVRLDGKTRQPGVFVIPWNIPVGMFGTMTPAFSSAAGAEVNPYHRAKCTAVAYGFSELLEHVRKVLTCVQDGTGVVA